MTDKLLVHMNNDSTHDIVALPQTIRLRPETPADEGFLYEVYASSRKEELDLTDWDDARRQSFLNLQFTAQRQGYQNRFPQGEFLIVLMGENRAGRMVVNRSDKDIRLVDIAFLPLFRKKGIGRILVSNLITEAKTTNKTVSVSVFKWGQSAGFYSKLGFVKTEDGGMFDQWEWRLGKE